MALDRNTQINFQGDPAKEKQFIESQDERTTDVARAKEPQLVVTSNDDLTNAIKAADVLDPTQKVGYDAPDAPAGSEQGAHVNAKFEDEVRTGADASGDAGEAANDGEAVDTDFGNVVEVADPKGGDAKENKKKK